MGKGAMAKPMTIESKTIDLAKHLGHKVSMTGPDSAMGMGMAKLDAMGKSMPACRRGANARISYRVPETSTGAAR